MDKDKIEAVKEYITNANDKDLARLFTEDFAKAVHLSMVFQGGNTKTQLAGIKMFHITLSMGYVKRNILHENATESEVKTIPTQMAGFTATDTVQGRAFSTTAQVPVLRLYQFLTTFTVQSGPDKGKPVLDGNAVSDKDFIRAVMRADYSTAYQNCVKGKMRCVITLLSKAYFKDWKEYRTAAARSIGLTAESPCQVQCGKAFRKQAQRTAPDDKIMRQSTRGYNSPQPTALHKPLDIRCLAAFLMSVHFTNPHKFTPFHSRPNFAAIISKSMTYGRKYGNGTGIARRASATHWRKCEVCAGGIRTGAGTAGDIGVLHHPATGREMGREHRDHLAAREAGTYQRAADWGGASFSPKEQIDRIKNLKATNRDADKNAGRGNGKGTSTNE